MPFQHPFHVLSAREIASVSSGGLHAVRAGLLHQFDRRPGMLLEIKGKYYSREQVESLLDALEHDLEFYVFVNRVPFLVRFLEQKEPYFLHDKGARQMLAANPALKARIDSLVIEVISDILPGRITQWDSNTAKLLVGIQRYIAHVDNSAKPLVYAEAIPVLEHQIAELRIQFPDAFEYEWTNVIHLSLLYKINSQSIQFFKNLPPEFADSRRQMAAWCNDACLVPFRNRHASLRKFPKASLQFIRDVASIAALEGDKLDNLKLVGDITRLSDSPGIRSRKTVLIVSAIALIGFLRLWVVFRDVWTDDHNMSSDGERMEEILRELGAQENDYSDIDYYPGGRYTGAVHHQFDLPRGGINPNRFNGGGLLANDQIHIGSIVDNADTTHIQFDCDIIPTGIGSFLQYIPADNKAKYAGREHVYKLTFRKKQMPEIHFAHLMHVSFGSYTKVIRGPRQVNSNDTIVVVKSLDPNEYQFKGFLTQIDTSGRIIRQDALEVRHETEGGLERVSVNGELADASNASEHLQQVRLRVRSVLDNISLLDDWVLSAGAYHQVGQLTSYAFTRKPLMDGQTEHTMLVHEFLHVDDRIRLAFQSEADGIAYFTGNHSNFDIKYMIDTKTGKIKGISMANLSQDLTTVERVELYRVK